MPRPDRRRWSCGLGRICGACDLPDARIEQPRARRVSPLLSLGQPPAPAAPDPVAPGRERSDERVPMGRPRNRGAPCHVEHEGFQVDEAALRGNCPGPVESSLLSAWPGMRSSPPPCQIRPIRWGVSCRADLKSQPAFVRAGSSALTAVPPSTARSPHQSRGGPPVRTSQCRDLSYIPPSVPDFRQSCPGDRRDAPGPPRASRRIVGTDSGPTPILASN